MKKILSFFILLSWSYNSIAQTIEHPAFKKSDIPAFHIKKVEITRDTTFVYCLLFEEAGTWASISKETFIRDSKNQKKYPLLRCVGLPISPEVRHFYKNESCELLFCFPSISGAESFDFIESEDERGFNIYGISLKRRYKTSYTDANLKKMLDTVLSFKSVGGKEGKLLREYATSLNNLESYNASIGNNEEVIRLGEIELKIKEKLLGKENPDYIESLAILVECNAILGNYDKAILLGTEEALIRKKIGGTKTPYYLYLLQNLVSYNMQQNNYNEAIRLQQEIANIKKDILGPDNAEYAYTLANLAVCYYEAGNYKESILFQTEATEIIKKNYGTDNLEYANSLSTLGNYYTHYGNYNEALRLGTEATELLKNTIGQEHISYARALSNLARVYSILGNYTKAINLEVESMNIGKSYYGTEHPEYAISLSNLAGYYQDIGNYLETAKLMTEATEIIKRTLGVESINYAISLNNLADYYFKVGNYSEAIHYGTEAMELYKRVIGKEHPLYALSLSNLANYNSEVGNYSEAIKLATKAIEIYKDVLGTEHPKYAASLNILAINNAYIGEYTKAIKYGTEAKDIYKKNFGVDHPDYAMSLNGLASYYSDIGDYTEAIRVGTEALNIRKKILGTGHPLYANSLLHLAGYNSIVGDFSEAIRMGTEAMEIFKNNLGTEHPYYSKSLEILARFFSKTDNHLEAFNCIQQYLRKSQSFVLHNFNGLSSHSQEKLWYYNYAYNFNTLLPLIATKCRTKQSSSELYDRTCLFAKSILLNTSIEMRKLILESGDSVIVDKYNALSANINLYNKLIEKPIKERFMDADSLGKVIERQEMELARESKAYGDYTHNLTISWKDVQSRLSDNDIAVEFLDFPIPNTDSTMYVALTLKKGYEEPHMVTLFESNQLKTIPENSYYIQIDASDLIWKPLEKELEGVKNIYFAPSGELHRIGIEYLPISKSEKICDVYKLHRLSSTRQLAVIQDESKGKNTILYGGINYDEKSNAVTSDSSYTKKKELRATFTYRSNVDSLSLRNSYDYLEGTKKEADIIAEGLNQHGVPYNYYSGTDATEESFKNQNGTCPKVMHIATHGFYLSEEEAAKFKYASSERAVSIDNDLMIAKLEYKPMTRSGLLFSGCNHTIRHEQIPESEEDGILTAQEISTLDLRGLDLVVLSACQTGLGDIVSGEGVFGLQRGFKKAGAKTIIMSLWNVNDDSTMKMMTSFYHHYLDGMSKEKAFRTAQDELRRSCPPQQERPDWAAFIMLDGLN